MTGEALLRVSGLAKSFGNRVVLRGLDLRLDSGQVLGLLGANGAGKTTTINIMTGLLPADSGEVTLGGTVRNAGSSARIGVAPQEVALYPKLTCAENVAFFGGLYGLRGRRLKARLDAVIELARLADYRDARVSTLSGGIRRRLNLAVAIVHGPALLILDEPTAGLDIEARYAVWETIRGLRASGTCVLLTTHHLDEAAGLCNRIALLHDGKIAREGTLGELLATVPAAQIAEIESDDVATLLARAAALGLSTRRHGGRIALLLHRIASMEVLVDLLHGVPIRSISLREVTLEDVFLEVTDVVSQNTRTAGHQMNISSRSPPARSKVPPT